MGWQDKSGSPLGAVSMDTAYVEKANGRWESWTYSSDGDQVYLLCSCNMWEIEGYCRAHNYQLVYVLA